MQTRSRSAPQTLQEAQQQVHGPKTVQTPSIHKSVSNHVALSALQQPGAASVLNASATSTDAVVEQLHPDSSQVHQPLETLIEVAETYFSAHNDADLLAAAQGVAGIWLLQDTSIRARLSTVLGPVLAREAQLSQRAAAIATKRQAVRAKAAEQGPRRSGRKRCCSAPPPAEAAAASTGTGATDTTSPTAATDINLSSNHSNKRRCIITRAAAAAAASGANSSSLKSSEACPPAAALSGASCGRLTSTNMQGSNAPASNNSCGRQPCPSTPAPADSTTNSSDNNNNKNGGDSSSDIASNHSLSSRQSLSSSRCSAGSDSWHDPGCKQQQQQQQDAHVEQPLLWCRVGAVSRRKQQYFRPHHAALQ